MIDSDKLLLVFSVGIMFANIFVAFIIVFFLLSKVSKRVAKYWKQFGKRVAQSAIALSFAVAAGSMIGSLFLSEIIKLPPCELCWYQRVFMYPLAIILLIALIRKSKDVFYYVLPLSVIGGLVAAYQYFLQFSPNPEAPCASVGLSISCSQRYMTNFGYITIPFMALSAFALIIIFMLLLRKSVVK